MKTSDLPVGLGESPTLDNGLLDPTKLDTSGYPVTLQPVKGVFVGRQVATGTLPKIILEFSPRLLHIAILDTHPSEAC